MEPRIEPIRRWLSVPSAEDSFGYTRESRLGLGVIPDIRDFTDVIQTFEWSASERYKCEQNEETRRPARYSSSAALLSHGLSIQIAEANVKPVGIDLVLRAEKWN